MKASIISALLVAGALAMPAAIQKRAIFTDEVVVTVWTTTTIYTNPTDAPAAFAEHSSSSSSVSSSASSSSAPPPSSAAPTTAAAVTTPKPVAAIVTPPPAVVTTPAAAVPAPVVPAPAPVVPAPAPAPASGAVASGTGDLTYYDLTAGTTSCGGNYANTDMVVALAIPDMANGANPNNNPKCNAPITITYNGVTVSATVVDTCGGCAAGSIDLSPTLFTALTGGLGAGRVGGATWTVT
jgi:hypothetical protein